MAYADTGAISLGFNPYDTDLDPDQPVVYMTKEGSETIYSVNYETGEIKTLTLPYPAERLEMYNHNLYVTQQMMSHNAFNFGPYKGGIAEVDTQSFTLKNIMNVDADPYDIAIDQNGFIYITPGSGQWQDMKVYSLTDKTEVKNNYYANMRYLSNIYYNQEMSKVYTINSDSSPSDVQAFEINNGIIQATYGSHNNGNYDLDTSAEITPDGLSMYNNSGVVYDLVPSNSGDMEYKFKLDQKYNDYAFDLDDQLTFAANRAGGIDVYKYNTTDYLYTLKGDALAEKLFFHNGLISIYSDNNGKYFLEYIKNYGCEPLANIQGYYIGHDHNGNLIREKFVDGVNDIPTDSYFLFNFNQNITISDSSKITLKGPDGYYKLTCTPHNNVLKIETESLLENADYTLTIEGEAISGNLGEKMTNGITVQFNTNIPPITSVSVTTNSSQAPYEYVFTANAIGGIAPQYKFLVNENGVWKVLQDYNSIQQLIWKPTKNGTYTFRVMTRSKGSNVEYEQYTDFTQEVSDTIPPSAIFLLNTADQTNKDVTIEVIASDNVGIDSITLPNHQVEGRDTAYYTVSNNGIYYFQIQDIFGNVTTEPLMITNIDKVKPKISLLLSKNTPTKDNLFIAADASDNVAVKKIALPDGTFVNGNSAVYKITKNGTYSFMVEDTAGNITSKSITVSNIDKTPPRVPTVKSITSSTIMVKGTAEKGTTVYIYNGKKYLGKGIVDTKGNFQIKIAKQKKNSKLQIYSIDKAKNQSHKVTITVK